MKYSRFIYQTSILYGYSLTFTGVTPDTGPSIGGVDFTCAGLGFDYQAFNDTFTGVALDLAKWTDISTGTGTVTTGASNLQLSTGATGSSVAGISMNATFYETQYEAKVNIPSVTVYPTSEVSLFTMQYYIDASNYGDMSVLLATDGSVTLECEVYKGAGLVSSYTEDWTMGLSTFKILVWMGNLYFYANGSLFFRSQHFVNGSLGYYKFFADNKSASYNVYNTVVEYIVNRPFVVFGDIQVVPDVTLVSDTRLRGLTPPSIDIYETEAAYAGLVDVNVCVDNVQTGADAYEYYYLKKLVILQENQFDILLSDITEDTVRTPELVTRGLGGGK